MVQEPGVLRMFSCRHALTNDFWTGLIIKVTRWLIRFHLSQILFWGFVFRYNYHLIKMFPSFPFSKSVSYPVILLSTVELPYTRRTLNNTFWSNMYYSKFWDLFWTSRESWVQKKFGENLISSRNGAILKFSRESWNPEWFVKMLRNDNCSLVDAGSYLKLVAIRVVIYWVGLYT